MTEPHNNLNIQTKHILLTTLVNLKSLTLIRLILEEVLDLKSQ